MSSINLGSILTFQSCVIHLILRIQWRSEIDTRCAWKHVEVSVVSIGFRFFKPSRLRAYLLYDERKHLARVARTNAFEVIIRVRYWAPRVTNSEMYVASLMSDDPVVHQYASSFHAFDNRAVVLYTPGMRYIVVRQHADYSTWYILERSQRRAPHAFMYNTIVVVLQRSYHSAPTTKGVRWPAIRQRLEIGWPGITVSSLATKFAPSCILV